MWQHTSTADNAETTTNNQQTRFAHCSYVFITLARRHLILHTYPLTFWHSLWYLYWHMCSDPSTDVRSSQDCIDAYMLPCTLTAALRYIRWVGDHELLTVRIWHDLTNAKWSYEFNRAESVVWARPQSQGTITRVVKNGPRNFADPKRAGLWQPAVGSSASHPDINWGQMGPWVDWGWSIMCAPYRWCPTLDTERFLDGWEQAVAHVAFLRSLGN